MLLDSPRIATALLNFDAVVGIVLVDLHRGDVPSRQLVDGVAPEHERLSSAVENHLEDSRPFLVFHLVLEHLGIRAASGNT
jgi:hypothetical protein